MQQANHPDDERLAALAADEPEAVADRALTQHVAACARCTPMVEELRTLHAALAMLPDVPPSRPLRFLPPAPEPAPARAGWLATMRALTAPAMAVAAVLIVVGAFGSAASSGFLGFAGGAASAPNPADGNLRVAGASAASAAASAEADGSKRTNVPGAPGYFGLSQAPVPTTQPLSGGVLPSRAPAASAASVEPAASQRPPYEWILGAGVVLLAAAFVARGYVRRRSFA